MKSRDEPEREIKVPRDRISKLSAASLRISASLDVSTVLHEIVEGTGELIGGRYGVVTTLGVSGQVQEFVTSGFTPDAVPGLRPAQEGLGDSPAVLGNAHCPQIAPAGTGLLEAQGFFFLAGMSSHLSPQRGHRLRRPW